MVYDEERPARLPELAVFAPVVGHRHRLELGKSSRTICQFTVKAVSF